MSFGKDGNKKAVKSAQSTDTRIKQKPKRPMTAYNFFFQEERRRILAGEDPKTAPAILASKNKGSLTGLSSSRKQRIDDHASYRCDDNDDSKSKKRKRDDDASEESITFEGLGRIIGKRWKEQKRNGDISKYTALAKVASIKYKEDIKRYYDEEMESMLRMGRNIGTVPVTDTKTNAGNGSFEQRSTLNDLPGSVNLHNKQDNMNSLLLDSRSKAAPPSNSEIATSQINIPLAYYHPNIQLSSLLMDNQPQILTNNIDPNKFLNLSFRSSLLGHFNTSIPNQPSTPRNLFNGSNMNGALWQQQNNPSMMGHLNDINNVLYEPITSAREEASRDVTLNGGNLGNILLPLNEITPLNTRQEMISKLLDELKRSHPS